MLALADRPSGVKREWAGNAMLAGVMTAAITLMGLLIVFFQGDTTARMLVVVALGGLSTAVLVGFATWAVKEDRRDAVPLSDADAREVLAVLTEHEAVDAFKRITATEGQPTYLTIDSVVSRAVDQSGLYRREDIRQ